VAGLATYGVVEFCHELERGWAETGSMKRTLHLLLQTRPPSAWARGVFLTLGMKLRGHLVQGIIWASSF
jgi:hypothetical protein